MPLHAFVLAAAVAAASPRPTTTPADIDSWFPGLTSLTVQHEGIRLWYPAAAATPVKTPPRYIAEYDEAGVYASEPVTLELGHGLPRLALACDSGPSADPSCRLLTDPNDPASALFESPGTAFVFTADAQVHVFGHTDSLYDHRRLFRFDGNRFVEAAQPYRYVGVRGRLAAPLALTAEKHGDTHHPLLTLPAGTSLDILLNAASGDDENGENADYLVKTPDGLVGWASIPSGPDGKTIVAGLYFAGD